VDYGSQPIPLRVCRYFLRLRFQSQPASNARQPFFFNHNRHNEFNLNLGSGSAGPGAPQVPGQLWPFKPACTRTTITPPSPACCKSIFRSQCGYRPECRLTPCGLDAGVLPSHIGFESAISMDNPTLTRSLPAENSPYFLTGAKLTFTPPTSSGTFAGLLVNGWQRIQRLAGNSLPARGYASLVYTPFGGPAAELEYLHRYRRPRRAPPPALLQQLFTGSLASGTGCG
jgi:hypothetical protein